MKVGMATTRLEFYSKTFLWLSRKFSCFPAPENYPTLQKDLENKKHITRYLLIKNVCKLAHNLCMALFTI